MLQIYNVQVYNLTEALIASGNAMRTELVDVRSLQEDVNTVIREDATRDLTNTALMNEYNNGLKRCAKLTQAGLKGVSCHSNYLTGILVSFDVVYPCYWSPESQRYHWFNIVTSSSKMHRLCKMRGEEYFNKYTDKRSIAILQEKIDKYNYIEDNTWTVGSPKYTVWSGHDSTISTFDMFMKYVFNSSMNSSSVWGKSLFINNLSKYPKSYEP